MEIESSHDTKLLNLPLKLAEDFENLSLELKQDLKQQSNKLENEKELLRECQNTWKNSTTHPQEISFDQRIKKLEMQIEEISIKVKNIPQTDFKETNTLIEKAQQDIYDMEANLLEVADKINTSMLPFMVDLSKTTKTLSHRIDSFWKSRSNNKYLKGEENRGFGINTEMLKQELENKYQDYKNRNLKLIHVNPQNEEEQLLLKMNSLSGIKNYSNSQEYFREEQAFCRYSDRGDKFIIYLPKNNENKEFKHNGKDYYQESKDRIKNSRRNSKTGDGRESPKKPIL